jgi:hypothetical protein
VVKQGQPSLSPGQTVTITGTVKPASEVNAELSGDPAQALSSQRCYIEATKIDPARQVLLIKRCAHTAVLSVRAKWGRSGH